MSVSLLVDLLPYWNLKNIGISSVVDERSFWLFLETFLGFCYTSSNFFLNFPCVLQSVCWLTSLLKGPSFGNLKDKWRLQDKPPGPVGYHYSPPATSPISSSGFALWANMELYILVPSLTNWLTFSLSFSLSQADSRKNLSILMLGLWNLVCCIPGHNH